jgi:uncharacterized membrane protein YccC
MREPTDPSTGGPDRGKWTGAASKLSPPGWLLTGLRPRPAPVPWAAVTRAAVALAAPLAVGFAVDEPGYGALVSIGALFGVICDTADAYRLRVLNIAVPQPFGALGAALGIFVHGEGWLTVGVLTLVALVSGMISSIGSVASFCGLLLLINTVLASGVKFPEPWWTAPLLLPLGGLFVLLLSLLAWPLRRSRPERAAVAGTYRAVADQLEAAGGALYDARRQATTQSLNQAYDLIFSRRARDHSRRNPQVRLLAELNALTSLLGAAAAAHQRDRPLPAAIPAAVRELAAAIAERRQSDPGPLPPPGTPAERAVDTALRHAASVVNETHPDPDSTEDRLGRPDSLRFRARRAALDVLFSKASWRYGLRLALCIGIAEVLVSLVSLPRSYWVVITVTFVLKPDFGSVFSRAVTRALGSVVGLVIAAAVVSQVAPGWWDVPVMAVLAALIPAMSAKGYGFQTAAVTPVVLLLTDLLSHKGVDLVLLRFVDSLIGCAIVLTVGYLLWPESWHARIGDRLADAVDDTAGYVRSAFGAGAGTSKDEPPRARMRRRVYRDLSVVRSEFQRALAEPPPTGTRAAAWWPLVVAVERIVDATTAARVRVNYGAAPPAQAEVAEIEVQLRELAGRVRSSEVLVEVRAELRGDEEGVLAPLRQEVKAAQAIASAPGQGGELGMRPAR